MPYPNEHACRLRQPGEFQPNTFRRTKREHEGKVYSIIMGKLKGSTKMTEQAYRYDKDVWSAAQARSHCKSHDGTFEAAAPKAFDTRRVLLKSAEGEYEESYIGKDGLRQWFEENTDEEGNVTKDIVIFQDAFFKRLDDGTIAWVLSDYSVDRDKERIDPKGWDLKQFKQNPIVLWQHDSSLPAIGKVVAPRVRDGQLVGRIRFSSKEVDPFAAQIEGKIREEIINAGSVGFKSNKVEIVDDKDEAATLIHRKQELYEFSIVNIPSNVNAMAMRDAKLEDEEPDELEELRLRLAKLERQDRKSTNYVDALFKDGHPDTRGAQIPAKNENSIESFFKGVAPDTREPHKAPEKEDSETTMKEFFNGDNQG